jgi:flavorubredoxin
MGFVFLDAMSYTATGAETLSPAGNVTGNALVVYDPGITGFAKDVAVKMAGDLQSKGYAVTLAGVRSSAAANASRYDVIVAGGPTYAGNVSSSIKSYLRDLKPSPDARIGIYWTGSYPRSDDPAFMRHFVTELPAEVGPGVKATIKLASSDDVSGRCEGFVAELLH